MASPGRSAVAPLYLFACLILGGSAQGSWQNMLLQLGGLAILAWAASTTEVELFPERARPLLVLAMAGIAVAALQLVPLPPAVWAHSSRAPIADGFRLLGKALPPEPVSLTPYASLSTLLCLIPPLAIFCAIVRLNAFRPSWLAAALVTGTLCGVLLGALQVSATSPDSPWYLYPDTNFGSAVGFFANANHMADLLVIALPFIAATAAAGRSRNLQRYSALLAVLAGVALVLVVGIALNRSLAAYALSLPAIAASALILIPRSSRSRRWLALLVALAAIVGVAVLASSAIGGRKIGQDATLSVQSREDILQTTGKAIADYLPFGSGLGSFVKVYRLYERPETVTIEYVVHAHNDYAELALELGVPGILLMLGFLAWWTRMVWSVWRTGEGGPFALAASISSGAILLHSLVDFPLRTAAISTCFAMCLALLAVRRLAPRQDIADFRPTRHVEIK